MERKELIKALLKGEKPNNQNYIFSWENHKVSEALGLFKIEIMDNRGNIRVQGRRW
jgi:hypothetical protein